MSTVLSQAAKIREKHGAGVSTFTTDGVNKVPVPLITRTETLVIAAYWFQAMRAFFTDAQAIPLYWSVASRSGEKWSHSGESDSLTKGLGLIGLDEYLALPPFNWLADRSGESAYMLDDRFMCRPLVHGIDAAVQVRANCDKDRKYYSSGTVWTLYSSKQSSRDGTQTFERYVRHMMNRWESLIGKVQKSLDYSMPVGEGIFFDSLSNDKQAHAFWQCIADIESDISRQGDVLKSMPSWDTWLSDSAHNVKSFAETTVKTSADAAGQAAAWAANTAGEAAGKAGSAFLKGIGVWGILFVAAIIALR
jgi:hypothetical protein